MKTNSTREKIISVSGLYKSFKTGDRYTEVLEDVSLEIYKGEFDIVFGPSGCGKSTLLHSVMGLEFPDSGNVQFGGVDMWKMNSDDRADTRKRQFGIMYQQQNWIKSLNVIENIAFPLQLLGINKEKALVEAKEVLSVVGLSDRAEYVPSELSSGEQQKIGLARSLVTKPKVIIADEPTGNLDVTSGLEIIKLLKELSETGITVVMVTHNPEYLEYSDRVFFMLDGEILRECITSKEDIAKIQKQIKEDLAQFIKDGNRESKSHKRVLPQNGNGEDIAVSPFKKLFMFISYIAKFFLEIFSFLLLFLVARISSNLEDKMRSNIARFFDRVDRNNKISKNINALDLTEIAFKNIFVKRARTLITVFGISLGIGFIVFLLSIGYGVEKLVINQVTEIQNQNQIDIRPVVGSKVVLDAKSVNSITAMEGVSEVYPLNSAASRVRYKGSLTDTVAYGISEGYLESFSSKILLSGEFLSEENKVNSAIVNRELLNTIGLNETEVLEETFVIEVLTAYAGDEEYKDMSESYKIVGVVDDDNSPIVYLDISKLNDPEEEKYSQLTLVTKNNVNALELRKQIEALGFETSSISDTVSEVEDLFNSIKLGLALFGIVAFVIAVLGMINTLTVSLLERTREVGLMKTIGVKSFEIRSIFLSESMLMGFAGGVFGVLFGMVLGLLATIVVSGVSLLKGGEFIWINNLPVLVILLVVVLSSIVGFITGLYPSSRAVKMAPLDALRYE